MIKVKLQISRNIMGMIESINIQKNVKISNKITGPPFTNMV